jgi:hypothetical protein
MTSASLIGAAKVASNGKYREVHVGERVIYIFSADKAVAQAGQTAVAGKIGEVAVTAIDDKTLAFGDLDRVRQTLEGKTRVSPELLTMLEKDLTSVASFAVKTPAGLKSFLPLENDELGKNIDAIRYVYGNANMVAGTATIHATARTLQNAQATSPHETLSGLQVIGKAFLGGAKGADKQVYSRLIENAKFAVKGNEVTFDLTVPQSDIDILVGMIK